MRLLVVDLYFSPSLPIYSFDMDIVDEDVGSLIDSVVYDPVADTIDPMKRLD